MRRCGRPSARVVRRLEKESQTEQPRIDGGIAGFRSKRTGRSAETLLRHLDSAGRSKSVSRDNPGQTALEQTIIRWAIDSDPQGARVFYRVLSSIPAVVKNTNETYLMTTPYEETRAFNILGLTYENSRDVQIEIKVVKTGYEAQVKRFNVRQAIDQ